MKGLHLTADLHRCRCEAQWLQDAGQLQAWCISAAHAVGLQTVAHAFHGQRPGGIAICLLVEDGHVCVHAWPAQKAATLDVYVGSDSGDRSAKARGLMDAMVRRFQPEWTEQRSLDRGEE